MPVRHGKHSEFGVVAPQAGCFNALLSQRSIPRMKSPLNPIDVAVIGTGWCGGIRAETLAAHPLVASLHIAETGPERLKEVALKTRAASAVADYRELLKIKGIEAVYISATPETTHYPMAR